MAKQGSGARNKGSKFERDTAKYLSEWWGYEFHRTPGSGSLHWSSSNNVAGDIVTPLEANFPYVVECKDHNDEWTLESVVLNQRNIKHWWNQVVDDALSVGRVPMLIFKRNRSSTFIMLPYNERLDAELAKQQTNFMITYVSYKDMQDRENRFKVIVFTKEDLKTLGKLFFTTLYPNKNWADASRATVDYAEEQKAISPSDYTGIIDDLLSDI